MLRRPSWPRHFTVGRCPAPATAAALALSLILAACSTPQPSPQPAPPSPPSRPGVQAFALDLSQPTIGLGLTCTGDVPPDCSTLPPQYTYGTFNGPAVNGHPCADPAPDCYTVEGGVLRVTSPGGGWPIITRQTFAGAQSHQLVASGECLAGGCWGGLVVYSGDAVPSPQPDLNTGEWLGIYFSHADDGKVQIGVWGPSKVEILPGLVFPAGAPLTFRIDYQDGRWSCFVQGSPVTCGSDTRTLTSDPHAALFMGDLSMSVTAWDVFTGP